MGKAEKWLLVFVLGWAACMFYLLSLDANASEYDFRIGAMPESHHFHPRKRGEYNEKHEGILLELRTGKHHYLGVVNYDNSYKQNSNAMYLGADYEVYSWLDVGYQVGIVSGYAVDPSPLGAFTVTAGGKHVKGRLIVVPDVVVGYQFLLEF